MEEIVEIYWRYYDTWQNKKPEIHFFNLYTNKRYWKGGSFDEPFSETRWSFDIGPIIIKWSE